MGKSGWIVLGTLGVAGAAYLGWKFLQWKNGGLSVTPYSEPTGYTASQPGLTYPFRPTVDPRVDNQNQPWYGGTNFQGAPQQLQTVKDTAGYLSAGSSIVHSISDIWGELNIGSLFGGDEYDLASFDFDEPAGIYEDAGMGFGSDYSNIA